MDLQRSWEVSFLALTVWREARGEPRAGKQAVACSVMNRVQRPKWWGSTVTEVLRKKWQYSSLTDPKDVQLTLWPPLDGAFKECLEVAEAALEGRAINVVPGADSYYDVSLDAPGRSPPKWAETARYCGRVGRIRFFDVDHDYEAPSLKEKTA